VALDLRLIDYNRRTEALVRRISYSGSGQAGGSPVSWIAESVELEVTDPNDIDDHILTVETRLIAGLGLENTGGVEAPESPISLTSWGDRLLVMTLHHGLCFNSQSLQFIPGLL
jgi:hypothetical protein